MTLVCPGRSARTLAARLTFAAALCCAPASQPRSDFAPSPCDIIPPAGSPRYFLPYPEGRTYRLIQGNCSGSTHAASTPYRFAFDFVMPVGDTVSAARAGVVIVAEGSFEDGTRRAGEENEVVILHSDASVARYVHLTRSGPLVSVGDSVRAGQPIGLSGDTGMSRGPHLHFDVATCEFHHCATIPIRFANPIPASENLRTGTAYTAGAAGRDRICQWCPWH